MPTRRIGQPHYQHCQNSEHNPPSMMVFEPGIYEHTCPGCGATQIFSVPGFTISKQPGSMQKSWTDNVFHDGHTVDCCT